MKRLLLSACILLVVGAFVFVSTGASNPPSNDPTYHIELDNAFGLVTSAPFKVSGVDAGTIESIGLDQKTLHAIVTVKVTTPGLGAFHSDVFCQSEPQSLIGEYFISCEPGSKGPVLPSGSTIPVTDTQSTIPADLLLDINRLPERERLTLIINELGAAVAGRSGDLQQALQRAVPALTETDNLLKLLANDSTTLQQLTANSNTVITALADNTGAVQRFIVEANNAAGDTAVQQANLQSTLQKLPPFLEQLKPAMLRLGQATQANLPVLENLNAASGQLDRLFTDLPAFSRASIPAIKSLGKASVTGKVAVQAAGPTVAALNKFAKPTPELAQNLSIVLPWIDTQKHATERNARSPGGKGYSGLEALLQFVFNLAAATNTYGPYGHQLAVDAFASAMCSPYATPATIAASLKQYGAAYRSCYSWLGPSQPGVNETDPSDPSACVPDPGGAPAGDKGPTTSACRLEPSATDVRSGRNTKSSSGTPSQTTTTTSTTPSSSSGVSPPSSSSVTQTLNGLGQTVSKILNLLGGGSGAAGGTGSGAQGGASDSGGSGSGGSQTQQLLNYLLSP
jgi:virulence factor Mce-like protein